MKRRNFLSNSAILSVSVPLGIATPAFISSCSTEGKKESGKKYTPEELGTFSFEIALLMVTRLKPQ
jgi:hypothetical protein